MSIEHEEQVVPWKRVPAGVRPHHPPVQTHDLPCGSEIEHAIALFVQTVRGQVIQPDRVKAHWSVQHQAANTFTWVDVRVFRQNPHSVLIEAGTVPVVDGTPYLDTAEYDTIVKRFSFPLSQIYNRTNAMFDTTEFLRRLGCMWRGENPRPKRLTS